jgi:hypothetical protein
VRIRCLVHTCVNQFGYPGPSRHPRARDTNLRDLESLPRDRRYRRAVITDARPGAWLVDVVERVSRSWRSLAGVTVMFFGTFALLMLAAAWFRGASGDAEPFDLQNGLTADDVRVQLAGYGDGAELRYLVFAAVDVFFPLIGALLLASVTAACLRSASPRTYERAMRSRLILLFFVPTLMDWTENAFAVWLVLAGEPASSFAITGLLVAKSAKLATLVAAQVTCVVAIVWWVGATLRRRVAPAPRG